MTATNPVPVTAIRYTDVDGHDTVLRTAGGHQMPKHYRTITEDQQAVDQRPGYRQVQCKPCGGTGRRDTPGFDGTNACGMCCSHGTLWTNNPNNPN